jgi:hypothetical protein
VGSSDDSPESILRPLLAIGYDAEILSKAAQSRHEAGPQSSNSHLGRFSMNDAMLHHTIPWNVTITHVLLSYIVLDFAVRSARLALLLV